MKTVFITGGSGLIGSRIQELLGNEYTFIAPSSAELDITDSEAVQAFVQENTFDYCLHGAAYTNVDGAEQNKEEAYAMNVNGTKNVFDATRTLGKPFLLLSTDFVFDGKNPPYDESSSPNPISVYGASKYEAEKVVGTEGMILRIAYPYRAAFEKKKDFVRTLKWLLEEGKELHLIEDSTFTPTFIDDIALALKTILPQYEPGIVHLTGSQSLSVYEAGLAIARTFGLDQSLIHTTTYAAFFEGKAQRPQFSEITSHKNTFYPMKSFEEGLAEMKKQLA